MITYANDYDRFLKQFRSKMSVAGLCSVLIALYVVSQISPCVCLAVDKVDFATFRQIHQEHYNLVQTGVLQMRYTEYEFCSDEELRREANDRHADLEQLKAKILQDPSIPPDKKNVLIAETEGRFSKVPKYFLLSERRKDTYQNFAFDLSLQKCKLDEGPLDPNFSEESGLYLQRAVLTSEDGTQIRYSKHFDQATLHENAVVSASKLPTYFGSYLGIVTPRQLRDFREDVGVFEDKLDGRDVVVYELTEPVRNGKLRIYADPVIGYRYRQVEVLSDGKVVRKITAKNYKFFDGIPFPTFHEDTLYSSDPNKPVRKRTTIQVENAQFNRDIDPNMFKIQFTTGTIITDPILGLRFKPCPDKSVKLGVEDILERVRAHRRK